MKVLLLNGSPHPNGCTFRALSEVEKTLQQEDIETEIFFIGHDPIRGCMGCGMCRKNKLGKCIFGEDAVNVVIKKMEECDGLIVGSPVHYAGASGGITSFLDRMFYSTGGFPYKPGANKEDIIGFLVDKNVPGDDIVYSDLADEILCNKPEQGYLTISNALQWRLQYARVIALDNTVNGVLNYEW